MISKYAAILAIAFLAGPALAQTPPAPDRGTQGAATQPRPSVETPPADPNGKSGSAAKSDIGNTTTDGSPGSESMPGSAGQNTSERR
jgi:hypothetical protein